MGEEEEEESINLVNSEIHTDDDESTAVPSPKRRRTVAAIITLSLFAIIIASIISAAVVHNRHTKPSFKAADSIKAVCAVTQNPESCITDISAVDSGHIIDPEMIFTLTLQLSVRELMNVSSLPKTLISSSTDLRNDSALRECVSLFDDAVSQLSRSVESMRVRIGDRKTVVMTEEEMADLMTWISAAMTDLETCVDGLEEMGSTAVDEVKRRVQRSNEYLSNSLAILGNMEAILDQFGLHLH
ncbi:pectinesterase 1-like [Bidens hawaiensis]|uniref:pectinesterase 1-like n=1 Tax=Bidens hawaiensis TaxID=980011 RepID=UPI00404A8B98